MRRRYKEKIIRTMRMPVLLFMIGMIHILKPVVEYFERKVRIWTRK